MMSIKIWENVKVFFLRLAGKFTGWYTDLNSIQKRRFALICTGIVAAFLTLSAFISISRKTLDVSLLQSEPERIIRRIAIPGDEIFLPDEPDFIPGVLLERERRQMWTEEDAALYWQDPLKYGEEYWWENIESAVEEVLERVP